MWGIVGMVWNFYISVAKGLKIKFRKFGWEIPKFPEVTGEKCMGPCPFLWPFWIGLRYCNTNLGRSPFNNANFKDTGKPELLQK